jgi:hypothetical protein
MELKIRKEASVPSMASTRKASTTLASPVLLANYPEWLLGASSKQESRRVQGLATRSHVIARKLVYLFGRPITIAGRCATLERMVSRIIYVVEP